MSSDASTLPLRDPLPREPEIAPRRRLIPLERRSASARGEQRMTWGERHGAAIAAVALAVIVVSGALIVLGAANRPSFLSAPSHAGFFPNWLAGPLGGLWPGFTRSAPMQKSLFTAALVVTFVAYLLCLRYVSRLRARWVLAALVAVHAIFLLAPPLALTDIFNYINYGRMGMLDHLNPYVTIPSLEPHTEPSFDLSNWHNLLSPYGPSFTLITYAVAPLGIAASLWSLKLLMAAASLATLALVWACARRLDRDPVQAVVLVGLNPIVLMWGLGGVHNDFLTVLCVMTGFYLLLRAGVEGVVPVGPREPLSRAGVLARPAPLDVAAGAAFVAATSLKASAGILIPVVIAGLLRAPRRLMGVIVGMLGAGIVLGAFSVIAFGPHLPNLGTQGRLVIAVSLPNLLGLILGQGGETDTMRAILSCLLISSVLASSLLAWRWRDSLTASGWATVALLVTLAWVLPWYILWVLPLAALSASRKLRSAALVLSAYLIVTWMPLATAMNSELGFYPTKTPLGELHQRYVKNLLN
jgi:hypothetical protein